MTVVQLAKSEPVTELVDVLKDLLDEAERGELVGLCVVAEYQGMEPWSFLMPCSAASANLCLDQLKLELVDPAEDD